MDIGGRIHSRFRPSTSDTFARIQPLGGQLGGQGFPGSRRSVAHPLPPVTFPVAPRVLMKQAGHSHEAKQTTDRRRAA